MESAQLRFSIFLFGVALFNLSCSTSAVEPEEAGPKFIPDHTPYIAGLVEATNDTVHFYPEVVVGYFTDPLDSYHEDILNPDRLYPGLYNTTLIAQLTKTSRFFNLIFEPEPDAIVKVQGPLGTEDEEAVSYTHTGRGVYGDTEYALTLVPGQQYRLTVTLPNESIYKAVTVIPEASEVSISDSIGIEVKYRPYGDGTPYEIDVQRVPILLNLSDQTYLLEMQQNTEHDRELLLMEPEEEFKFKDRSPYLRGGSAYGIGLVRADVDTITNSWGQRLDKPKEDIWMKRFMWYRLSFFSDGIGGNFFSAFDIYTANRYFLDTIDEQMFNALDSRDSTYLFDVSTIRKLDEEGNLLPKEESDAIGFFGGYFSVYRTTTLYPIRNFELDSVLRAHGSEQ